MSAGSLQGRVCIVTGASSGIGLETARGLAAQGATLVAVCRNRERGEAALASVRESTGNEDLHLALADLSAQASTRQLAKELLARWERIHVLVNNAGVFEARRRLTADGIERVFAVNHLSYYLLTRLLLDRLKESAPSRVVNVASDAHRFARLDWENLQGEKSWSFMRQYGLSKLCNILFTQELAKRVAGSGVTANALHPGAVGTRLGQNNGAWAKALTLLLRPFLLTPAQGADTSIYLASSADVGGVSGAYFVKRRRAEPTPEATDPRNAAQLWELSARLTGLPS
ncbi:MAG TPA: short-chain dehydrogenase [Deltaproteobacteria bacterium]|nr:short-chain dehydrogenase [Deltaproteobacteria bacterium]